MKKAKLHEVITVQTKNDIIKFKIDKNKGNCSYYVNNQFYGTIF